MSSSESESDYDENVADNGQNEKGGTNSDGEEAGETSLSRETSDKTFAELGLVDVLCEACDKVGWKKPSKIQAEANRAKASPAPTPKRRAATPTDAWTKRPKPATRAAC